RKGCTKGIHSGNTLGMSTKRKAYPSDVRDEEWEFCAPYLTLMKEQAPQRTHSLRQVFNALRWPVRAGCSWRMMPHEFPPWWVVQQQTQRWLRAGCFEGIAYGDQGYTGEQPAADAARHGLRLEVVEHDEAKKGFVLLPRRWVVERSFAWAARFRRLARDYERLASTMAGYHWLAFAMLMLNFIYPKSS